MVANLIPLGGVLVLDWDLGEVITLFWAENAVIGFYSVQPTLMVYTIYTMAYTDG